MVPSIASSTVRSARFRGVPSITGSEREPFLNPFFFCFEIDGIESARRRPGFAFAVFDFGAASGRGAPGSSHVRTWSTPSKTKTSAFSSTGVISGSPAAGRDADVFVFPSWTDTFGLVILEAMAAGTPVAAYPAHGPIDIIPGSGAGVIDDDLKTACLKCLDLDRGTVRAYAEKFSWRASAEQFVENLQPYPEPERGRFWRRLRRIARIRKRAAA